MFTNRALELEVAERRDERRHTLLARANIEIPGKLTLNCHAVDLSRGGMGLQSPVDVPLGQELQVTLPLDACGERRTVVLSGKVCYCKKQSENHFRLGLQFVHLDEATAAFIEILCP